MDIRHFNINIHFPCFPSSLDHHHHLHHHPFCLLLPSVEVINSIIPIFSFLYVVVTTTIGIFPSVLATSNIFITNSSLSSHSYLVLTLLLSKIYCSFLFLSLFSRDHCIICFVLLDHCLAAECVFSTRDHSCLSSSSVRSIFKLLLSVVIIANVLVTAVALGLLWLLAL